VLAELADSLVAMCDAQHDEASVAFAADRSVDHVLQVAAGRTPAPSTGPIDWEPRG
jgi:hypothetical protein